MQPRESPPQSPRGSRRRRPWSKSSAAPTPAAPATSADPQEAAARSASSPLAVSVSELASSFGTTARLRTSESADSSGPLCTTRRVLPSASSTDEIPAATTVSSRELASDYRGKCLYQSRKCENERALKRNGKAHNLCDEHRTKQNQHQRKFDAKKFSRKHREDSDDEAETEKADDNNNHDDVDASKRSQESAAPPARSTRKRKGSQRDSLASGTPEPPQRKIRRFDGAKHASRCQRSKSKDETPVGSSASASLQGLSRLLQPPYASESPADSTGQDRRFHDDLRHSRARDRALHPQQQEQQQYNHYQRPHDHEEQSPGLYFQSASGASSRIGAPGDSANPPSAPLLPLATIINPIPALRISPTRHHTQQRHHPSKGVSTEVHESHGVDVHMQRVSPSYQQQHQQQQYPHQQNSQHQHQQQQYPHQQNPQHQHQQQQLQEMEARGYPQQSVFSRYPRLETYDMPTNRSLPPAKYTSTELIAASILVPGVTPVSRQLQQEFASSSKRGGRNQPQLRHTSVSPRGAPVMHPSAYAISPHHTRLQALPGCAHPEKQYQEQQQQQEQEHFRHFLQPQASVQRIDCDVEQSLHSDRYHARSQYSTSPQPPATTSAPVYPPLGPPRILPPLSAHSTGVQRALPSPSLIGPHRGFPPQPQQHHQFPPHLPMQPRPHHAHQQPPITSTTAKVAPVLPSLAPLLPRNQSNSAPRRSSTPTSSI